MQKEMKRCLFCLGICAAQVLSVQASVNLKSSDEAHHIPRKAPAALDVYYHTPEGVTFSGLNKNAKFDDDFAYAPANKWLSTAAEVSPSSATFTWTYPISQNEDGNVKYGTSTLAQFNFRMREPGLFDAPVLEATSSNSTKSYTMAGGGIKYGEYGSWQNFAVNYQPSLTTALDQANIILSTNDAGAKSYLNMIMAGGLFTDITVYGFGESFYYSDNFYLQAINAFVYCEHDLTRDDIAVKVFKREKTTVSYNVEVAKLTTEEVTSLGDNTYYVEFRCNEPQYVTTAMQVVVLPAEGKDTRFSPMIPLQKHYRASNMGTASLYSTFTFSGKKTKTPQCLDFFGTEVSDDDDNSLGFLNNWAIGVKGSYTEPAGIDNIIADDDNTIRPDDTVYNLNGVAVGKADMLQQLPAGFYICNRQKIIIR